MIISWVERCHLPWEHSRFVVPFWSKFSTNHKVLPYVYHSFCGCIDLNSRLGFFLKSMFPNYCFCAALQTTGVSVVLVFEIAIKYQQLLELASGLPLPLVSLPSSLVAICAGRGAKTLHEEHNDYVSADLLLIFLVHIKHVLAFSFYQRWLFFSQFTAMFTYAWQWKSCERNRQHPGAHNRKCVFVLVVQHEMHLTRKLAQHLCAMYKWQEMFSQTTSAVRHPQRTQIQLLWIPPNLSQLLLSRPATFSHASG